MAMIHLVLWFDGYRDITAIGAAFLANTIGGVVLAAALVTVSRRWLALVGTLAALFLAGTLAALLLSATVGLFGLPDTLDAPLAPASLIVEAVGTIVCATTVLLAARDRPPRLRRDPGSHLRLREPR